MDVVQGIPPGREPWKPHSFELVKYQKRLWLKVVETGELVYTPPEWIRSRMKTRQPMQELAAYLSKSGKYDINIIIKFEANYSRKSKIQD